MLTQLFLKVAFVGSEWVLWLLLLINFISVATIVERILYLRRTKVDSDELSTQLDQFLRAVTFAAPGRSWPKATQFNALWSRPACRPWHAARRLVPKPCSAPKLK